MEKPPWGFDALRDVNHKNHATKVFRFSPLWDSLGHCSALGSWTLEKNMNQADRQDAYTGALETAYAQLDDLLANWNQLQVRKERLEVAAEALKSFFESDEQVAPRNPHSANSRIEPRNETPGPAPCRIERFVEPPPLPRTPTRVESSDPIQRRIDDVLGIGAVA
jgi:hypothetical protein